MLLTRRKSREAHSGRHPMSVDTVSFIAGGLFLAVAILGGGIEIRELKIPSVGRISRSLSFIAGIGLICLAIFLGEPGFHSEAGKKIAPGSTAEKEKEWFTASEYQQIFDKKLKDGFYPAEVRGKCANDVEQFHAEWGGLPLGFGFESHHAVTKEFYDQRNQQLTAQ